MDLSNCKGMMATGKESNPRSRFYRLIRRSKSPRTGGAASLLCFSTLAFSLSLHGQTAQQSVSCSFTSLYEPGWRERDPFCILHMIAILVTRSSLGIYSFPNILNSVWYIQVHLHGSYVSSCSALSVVP